MQEKVLGDYQVLKKIGRGALGDVFLSQHRFLKKQFVLKVLPQELAEEKRFLQSFDAQVAKIASLEHPHIVKVHNVSSAEGLYFLVTDCIVDSIGETTNLAQYMAAKKEPLSENELISVLKQVAGALDYAHSSEGKQPLIHGGFKLNNILVGRGSPGIDIFISDFSLATIVGAHSLVARTFKEMSEAFSQLCLNSHVQGEKKETYTPQPIHSDQLNQLSRSFLQHYAFLSPEQKRGEVPTAASDVYAFGVLAYFLIAGEFPQGSVQKISEVGAHYTFEFDHLIEKCLAHNPGHRPQKLSALFEEKSNIQSVQNKVVQEKVAPQTFATLDSLKKSLPPKAEVVQQVAPQPVSPTPVAPTPIAPTPVAPAPVASVVVESKSALEATPQELNPPKDETYSQALQAMLKRDPVVTHYQPEVKQMENIQPIETPMVLVEGGAFFRGSDAGARDEMPRHKIQLAKFAIDIHPVTNEQFVRFLEFMGGEKDKNYHDLIRLKESRVNRSAGMLSIESGYSKHPVVGVTWYGAHAYADWVGKRLPFEAEWEVAGCGGVESPYYITGENVDKSRANYFSSDTTAVKSYQPNGYGLYDMAGNVYEWCQDWYGYNYYETSEQEPNQPTGPQQGVYRVLKGGCWKSLKDDLRTAHRHRNNPGTVNKTYGFRCASTIE